MSGVQTLYYKASYGRGKDHTARFTVDPADPAGRNHGYPGACGKVDGRRNGGRATEYDETAAHAYISQPEFSISIDLHQGTGSCLFWTTDLTHGYIHINADYSS